MRSLLLGIALLLPMAGVASAAFVAEDDSVILSRQANSGQVGGAFDVYVNRPVSSGGGNFKTFCVELTQYISLENTPYSVNKLADRNSSADPSASSGVGILTPQVAWLYTQFANGNITGDNTIQYGIWRHMGYTHEAIDAAVNWNVAGLMAIVDGWFGNSALGWSAWGVNNLGGVQIMQLVGVNGAAQDQLVPGLPTPSVTATPEPTTFAIWGGLATLGLAVRAYRRQG